MSHDDVKPLRSWRDIAKQTAEEHDPNEVLKLAQELIRVLDAESNHRMESVSAKEKTNA